MVVRSFHWRQNYGIHGYRDNSLSLHLQHQTMKVQYNLMLSIWLRDANVEIAEGLFLELN